MKLVVQRVSRAAVRVKGESPSERVGERVGEPVAEIGAGMLVLLAVLRGDGPGEARRLAQRLARLRFFVDDAGRMNRSSLEVGAACLVVSQFTLAADGRKGRRPSFDRAAEPALAEPLCREFCAALEELGLTVATGRFGAEMQVELVNEGPATFVLECEPQP